jgi:DNA-binding MarR family transcriptional regulator
MMGLAAKSSTEDWLFDNLLLGTQFQNLFFHLAYAFTQLAKERLTPKQLQLLFATRLTLRYYSNLSPTGLAENLSKKLRLPLSTTKFNLAILKRAGLLETKSSSERRNTVHLSYGGKLLTQLLSEPKME